MTLYRIEDKDGKGVYHSEVLRDKIAYNYAANRQPMPEPHLLEPRCSDGEFCLRFAFPSLVHLSEWFNRADRWALREVVRVSLYRVDDSDARVDDFQASFPRCRATLLSMEELPA